MNAATIVSRRQAASAGADYDWRYRAACRDEDPELFFPIGTTGPALRQVSDAKAVCARCPVSPDCRDDAVRNRDQNGVFGGFDFSDASDRRRAGRLAKQRQAQR